MDIKELIPDVPCKYGSPMGRPTTLDPSAEGKAYLRKVPFVDGDYDRGGAYWGAPANLWVVAVGDDRAYYRASSRDEAKGLALADFPGLRFYR